MNEKGIKLLYVVAALYDGILGLAFIFFPLAIFEMYAVTPPNHVAYVQFPALLLLVFAAMFLRIASDPVRHRDLIPYGCGLKLAYVGTVFWYEVSTGIPSMWIPWAWADLVFLALFAASWWRLGAVRGQLARQ